MNETKNPESVTEAGDTSALSTAGPQEAVADAANKEQSEQPAQDLNLEFRADASEYFRIWIVNLFLTLLTFGVFSAWAKVRKKRYFYSHTVLDDTPFQYLAQPIPILKGRLIAVVLFVTYYASSNYFTFALPYVLVAGLLLAPWVVMRSAQFNAHYSAYRNLRFRFKSSYWDALQAIYWLGVIPLLVIGTLFDWWGRFWLAAIVLVVFLITFPWWIRRLKHYIVSRTWFGGANAVFKAHGGQFFIAYLLGGLVAIGLGLLGALLAGFALMVAKVINFDLVAVLVLIPVYAGYVLAYAIVQARIGNAVWNGIHLGPIQFESTLTGTELFVLYLTNALGIIFSLGLLTPWAVVRTYKYRVDKLRVFTRNNFEGLAGGDAAAVHAAGSEVGDFFDVDISL